MNSNFEVGSITTEEIIFDDLSVPILNSRYKLGNKMGSQPCDGNHSLALLSSSYCP